MSQKLDRKAALAAFNARKVAVGIYVIRSAGSGEVWVGHSRDLGAIERRIFFTLRMGDCRPATLQTDWNAQDGQGFAFEVLETVDDPTMSDMARADWLEARQAHWVKELNACSI